MSIVLKDISSILKKEAFGMINIKSRIALIILLVLASYGFLLRIYDLGSQSFWIDESYSAAAAMGIIEHGLPYMPSGELYLGGVLNTYFIALSMKAFGVSEFSARLPSVAFGVMTIVLSYFFFKKLFGENVGLITAFLIAFSAVEIAWSRQARMYQQFQFFYLLSLCLFYKYCDTKKLKFGVLTILSVLSAILTHSLGLSLLLVFPVYFIISNMKGIKGIASIKREFFKPGALAMFFLFLASLILSEVFFHAFTQVITTRVDYSEDYLYYLKTFFPVISYLFVIGALISFREDWKKASLLILACAVPLYFILFHEKLLGYRYVFLIFPVMFAFFAKAAEYASKIISRNKAFQVLSLVLIVLLASLTPALNFSLKGLYYLEPLAPQPDFDNAFAYLKENSKESDALIVSYPEIAIWYNQTPDYWLAFPISGFSSSLWLDESGGYYERTMTPAIVDLDGLEKVYSDNPSGWIVLDGLSEYRIPSEYKDFMKANMGIAENATNPEYAEKIILYHWNKN